MNIRNSLLIFNWLTVFRTVFGMVLALSGMVSGVVSGVVLRSGWGTTALDSVARYGCRASLGPGNSPQGLRYSPQTPATPGQTKAAINSRRQGRRFVSGAPTMQAPN